MMLMKRRWNWMLGASLLFLLSPIFAHAADANFSFKVNGSVRVGKTFSVEVVASATKAMNATGGTVSIADTNCVEIVSIEGLNGSSVTGHKYIYANLGGGITSATSIAKINLRAKDKVCTTTLSVSNVVGGFTDDTSFDNGTLTKSIQVLPPASTNNNLSQLSVSTGELSPKFNASTTSYKVAVKNEVSSINIQATAADSKAKVSGTGNKKLNYGNNKFSVVVTAEDGSKKTYTIQVNREDLRSSEANLKELTVGTGSLSPSFSEGVLEYDVSVPESLEKLDVTAVAKDEKAKVTIGDTTLKDGITDIKVTVKAENGTTKEYVIHVLKGDAERPATPDDKVSSLLKSITLKNGSLRGSFDANTFTYFYEKKDGFAYEYEAEDQNATVNVIEKDDVITFVVTASDGSVSTYCLHPYVSNHAQVIWMVIAGISIVLNIGFGAFYLKEKKKHA